MRKALVVIDPGHGGRDPGAIGPSGLKEADVNLLLAHLVKSRLERAFRVLMTRMEDQTVSLAARCALANTEGADLFVSLHCNAAANVLARGTESYYMSAAGKTLAEHIHRGLVALGLTDRGVKRKSFHVLRHTNMTAVLVEVAFITNSLEEARLASTDFLNVAADAIAKAIQDYMQGGNRK